MRIDEVVDRYIPQNKQRGYLFLSFFSWIVVSYGVLLGAFTAGSAIKEFAVSELMQAFVKSSVFIGMLIGAFLSGWIADLSGRKIAMNLYLLFATFFTFIGGFSRGASDYVIWRMLAGFGYGGLMPSVNAYLSETTSIRIRGRYLVFLESMWAVGSILVGLVHVTVGKENWRWDYWLMGLGLVLLFFYLRVPESPRFVFMKKGKRALEEMLGVEIEGEIEEIKVSRVPVAELLKGEYLKRTLMIWSVWFVLSIVYYGIFLWLPKIFAAKGVIQHSISLTFLMFVFQLPGYLLAAYLIEKIGRVASLTMFLFGTAATALGFALITSTPVYITMALLTSVFCLGAWGIVYAYTPELYPTNFRTTGNGTAGTVTRIAGIIAPYITISFASVEAALIFFSVISAAAGLAVMLLGVETMGKEIG